MTEIAPIYKLSNLICAALISYNTEARLAAVHMQTFETLEQQGYRGMSKKRSERRPDRRKAVRRHCRF